MVGAFWTIDALFAFANAGALSFHLHWGKGGEPSGDNPPSVGVQTNFILKVSRWFGSTARDFVFIAFRKGSGAYWQVAVGNSNLAGVPFAAAGGERDVFSATKVYRLVMPCKDSLFVVEASKPSSPELLSDWHSWCRAGLRAIV
jgi:hypothetical protein